MFLDANTLETELTLQCQVCIIGAGAAGITLARELALDGFHICMLEAGSLEYSDTSQSIYEGHNIGIPYLPLDICRLRYFGGTTNHWDGRCQPLSEIDFRKRPWVPYSGWPITREELFTYYARAHSLLKLGPVAYEEENWRRLGFKAIGVDRRKLIQRRWQYSTPVRFGEEFHVELERAKNVRVILNASATYIQATAAGNFIATVNFRTLKGRTGRIVANAYILACGGIENARLLLLSNDVHKKGLGNTHDHVGRYFMTHATVPGGVILSASPKMILDTLGASKSSIAGLHPSESLQESNQILNAGVLIGLRAPSESGIAAAASIKRDIEAGIISEDLVDNILRVIRDIDEVAIAAWQRYAEGHPAYGSNPQLSLNIDLEQAPIRDSRITLAQDHDALGLPRVALDLRQTDLHTRTALVVTRAVAAEFGRLGLGRIRIADWLRKPDNELSPDVRWKNHHMGTTRMSNVSRDGVVDSDCKVHSIDNLYIAGSSVFSTGGYANPTLTIVALALRLANHISERFA